MTKNGTVKSTTNPWKIETIAKSCPQDLMMIGNVVSIVVAPPAEIGASRPKTVDIQGARSNVAISRMMLLRRAMVPSSGPLYSVMKMLLSE